MKEFQGFYSWTASINITRWTPSILSSYSLLCNSWHFWLLLKLCHVSVSAITVYNHSLIVLSSGLTGSRWQGTRTCAHLLWEHQLAFEQPWTGGCWNPPKKDTPHLKTKEKPQWDSRRGVIMLKSNPILAEWVTHKLENSNAKKFSHWCEGTEPHVSFPEWRSSKETRNLQGIWLWSPVGFDYGTSTGLGEMRLQSWRTQTKSCVHKDPEERSSDPIEDWTKTTC